MSRDVMPCAGGSPEQFRIYEALEAGAVPLMLPHIYYHTLKELGLNMLSLPSWSMLPTVLEQLDTVESESFLETRSFQLQARWAEVKGAITKHVARRVCSLSSVGPGHQSP